MKTPALAVAALLALVPAVAVAQMAGGSMAASPSASPVSDAFRQSAQRYARNLTAAVEMFPADKFVYKPTDAQMTVGAIAEHLIEGNDMLCSAVGGTPAPQRGAALTETSPKDQLMARLRESFQFCDQALAGLTDAQMADQVPSFGGRTSSRGNMLLITQGDWADHYSQLAIYLRLNNMLPPTAQRRPGM